VSAFVVRAVTATETRSLRQRVLRPAQRAEELVYPHDDDADTLHVGAFTGDAMVGTATIHRERAPAFAFTGRRGDGEDFGSSAWRLRGMATLPEMRRRGCGAALVAACVAHARARGGAIIWCNARTPARAFYEALGFAAHGDEFDLPAIGPHYLMSKTL
jgi:GNAT superfamily N-acetyltransferase